MTDRWRASGPPTRCVILMAIMVLNGCVFAEPFEEPEVVAGSETTVTLRTGNLRNADVFAKRYCDKYWRRAVLMSRGKLTEKAITYHVYDCVTANDR